MFKLQLYSTTGLKEHTIEHDAFVIGRSRSCDIKLDDAGISAKHITVVNRNGEIWITDLNTPGGTYVNGDKILPNMPFLYNSEHVIRTGRSKEVFTIILIKKKINKKNEKNKEIEQIEIKKQLANKEKLVNEVESWLNLKKDVDKACDDKKNELNSLVDTYELKKNQFESEMEVSSLEFKLKKNKYLLELNDVEKKIENNKYVSQQIVDDNEAALKQVDELTSKIKKREEELSLKNEALYALDQKIDDEYADYNDLLKDVKELLVERDRLNVETLKLKEDRDRLGRSNEILVSQEIKLREEIELKSNKRKAIEERDILSLEFHRSKIKKSKNELNVEIVELQSKKESLKQEIEQLYKKSS